MKECDEHQHVSLKKDFRPRSLLFAIGLVNMGSGESILEAGTVIIVSKTLVGVRSSKLMRNETERYIPTSLY